MPPTIRLLRPYRGWVRLLVPEGTKFNTTDVELIPGIRVDGQAIDLPHTTWMLPEVEALVEAAGHSDALYPSGPQPAMRAWVPRRELYGYQCDGVDVMLGARGFVLGDDMGLGKTPQAIVAAESMRRHHGDRPALVIAPLFTRDVWRRELAALGAVGPEAADFCALVSRDPDDASFQGYGISWYFVHYDVVRAWWSKLYRLGPQRRPCAVIVDEAHWVKNARTQRAKGTAVATGTANWRCLLTGTPMDNKPADLWHLLTIASGPRTWGHPLAFRQRYCGAVHSGYGWQDQEPTHVEELRRRLDGVYLRRTADDVGLELPDLTRSYQMCDMADAERREHDDVLGTVHLDAIVRAIMHGHIAEVLPVISRLRQITSQTKIRATAEFVLNAMEQEPAVVVFCWERRIAEALAMRLETGVKTPPVVVAHGGFDQKTVDETIESFQRHGGVLVSTIDKLREGVTLHRARIVVMHDLDWKLTKILQAEKRIHRIGQLRACQSVWMLARDSFDTVLAPILAKKAEAMAQILDMDEGVDATEDLLEATGAQTFEQHFNDVMANWEAM